MYSCLVRGGGVNVGNSDNASSCFGGLFASMFGGSDSKQSGGVTQDSLIAALIRLLTKLVQTPLVPPSAVS